MKLLFFGISMLLASGIYAGGLDDIWQAMEEQDDQKTMLLLSEALNDPDNSVDAAMLLIMLNNLESQPGNFQLMKDAMPLMSDPNPYMYALWYTDAVMDGYGKKDKERLQFLNELLESDRINSSIKVSANYLLGMHYLLSNNIREARKSWNRAGSIKQWQFVGSFDNSSGSGFDKNYRPKTLANPEAIFKSDVNALIHWYTPAKYQDDPWMSINAFIPSDDAVIYAQSFVDNPEEREVIVTLGGSGSMKMWLNDRLLFTEEEELRTDFDLFSTKVTLPKGNNRLLVQLGYTDETYYPNFSVRLLDTKWEPIEGLIATTVYQPFTSQASEAPPALIPHFAEAYFLDKIERSPDNPINYLLLSRVYYRSNKYNEAIDILKKAQELYPDNMLINYQLLLNYNDLGNRTEILLQIEHMRNLNPDMLFLAGYDFEVSMNNENYEEAEEKLEIMKGILGSDDPDILDDRIRIMAARQNYTDLLDLVEKAFELYPENTDFLGYEFRLTKQINQSSTQAVRLLEQYLKNNFDSEIYDMLLEEYLDMGERSKAEKIMLKLHEMFPEEVKYINNLLNYNYQLKNYKKSLAYVDEGIAISPYSSSLWNTRSFIDEALGENQEAALDIEKAIDYDPNLFEARERLRELQGKKPLLSYFRNDNAYDLIDEALNGSESSDDNYEYIFNERNYAVFQEGASVEYSSMAVKILNESGVETWKEASIGLNRYWQVLNVEKAEVVKKNGQKITAEQNYNQMVFPSLETGDAVYIEYRIENYTGGKLSKEFWRDYLFNHFVPVRETVLRLFTPQDYHLVIETSNIDIEPEVNTVDEFQTYEWRFKNPEKCEDEPYMPSIYEVGMAVHISTLDSWRSISEWYSDLALPQAREDYNLNKVYDEIFEGKQFESDYEKARAIYDYICENINYSSVSFRQSNYIPQKPMVTISTQLGDCKDLSTLYHTLARKQGLETHLVLVNTRDNGENALRVPSTDFNHCIVKIDLEDGPMYQELTDNKLPFGALPNSVRNAQALVIPNSDSDPVGEDLIKIPENVKRKTAMVRKTLIAVDNDNLEMNTALTATGAMASNYRHHFTGLTGQQTEETVLYMLSDYFDTKLELDTFHLINLEMLDSSFTFSSEFELEDEVKTIGGMKAIRPPFFEVIFNIDAFPKDERQYPILYWEYENADYYETVIDLELPKGTALVEMPDGLQIKTDFIDYTLEIQQLPDNHISLKRVVNINNDSLSPEVYPELKEVIRKIVKAEDIFLVYR